MRNEHKRVAAIVAGLFAAAGILPAEAICGPIRPLKPVRCVCGKMIDQTGGPAADIKVEVAKDGEIVATTRTSREGKFTFDKLPAGKYELSAKGFEAIRSPIVVVRPTNKSSHGMRIVLVLSYPDNCGSYVVKQ